jgi:hypothetical protein
VLLRRIICDKEAVVCFFIDVYIFFKNNVSPSIKLQLININFIVIIPIINKE